jgi:hypothetical protein
MKEPEFKMGMCFPTVNDLRKALTEYSIKNRTVVAYQKNDKERLRAYCPGKPPCPWFIYAARDSRKNCSTTFVVKKYTANHECEREWKLKVFTSNYLAKHYINTSGTF